MDFLGIGPMELLVILVVAMIFLGPQRIVQVAAQLGKTVREFRKASSQLTDEITRELTLEEPKKPPPQPALPSAPQPPGAQSRSGPPDHKP